MTVLGVLLPGVDPVSTALSVLVLVALYGLSIGLASFFEPRWRGFHAGGRDGCLRARSGFDSSPRSARWPWALQRSPIVAVLAHRTPGPAGATNAPATCKRRADGDHAADDRAGVPRAAEGRRRVQPSGRRRGSSPSASSPESASGSRHR